MSLQNIRKVLRQVDAIDRQEGMVAYERYHDLLSRIANHYSAPFDKTVAVFCSLSPNNDYMGNLRSTVSVLQGWQEGRGVDDVTVSTYKACRNRAWAYLTGRAEFVNRTRGQKVLSFYQNILDPSDMQPVTIDGHMYCIWAGKRMTMVKVAYLKFHYNTVAGAFREVAREEGIRPNQLQGMLWFTWKRINNVLYRPQMQMFRPGDHWGLCLKPEDIKPFKTGEEKSWLTSIDSENKSGNGTGSPLPSNLRNLHVGTLFPL